MFIFRQYCSVITQIIKAKLGIKFIIYRSSKKYKVKKQKKNKKIIGKIKGEKAKDQKHNVNYMNQKKKKNQYLINPLI